MNKAAISTSALCSREAGTEKAFRAATKQQDIIVRMLRNEPQGGTDLVWRSNRTFSAAVPYTAQVLLPTDICLAAQHLYIDLEVGVVSVYQEENAPLPVRAMNSWCFHS